MVCSEEMPGVTVTRESCGQSLAPWLGERPAFSGVSGSPSCEHGEDHARGCWEGGQEDDVTGEDSPHLSAAQRVRERRRGGGSAGWLAGGVPSL